MNELVAQPKQENKPDPHRRFACQVDGNKLYLSEKERTICEVFVRTNGNLSECARVVNARFRRKHGPQTIKAWITRKRLITRYLEDIGDKRAELEAFTPDEWKLIGIEVMKGKRHLNPIQRAVWADYGKLEVYKDGASGGGIGTQTNIQIRFGEKE